jgi:putative endonuclease
MNPAPDSWLLYVLRCKDGSLYCGITNNFARRLEQHNAGTGAKYTSGRRPVELARLWPMENRSTALKAEADFKKLSRKAKFQRLIPPL